ncbi:MAG: PadR family transcriptional regulator [Cellulomonadaceae bacterium]
MSIRLGLMALLAEQPMHGYQLKQEFESRTGQTWPLNIGQVYTTVQRLVRDGLVEPVEPAGDPEQFRLTSAGRAEIDAWWDAPVPRGTPARDELAIKLALAVTVPGVNVVAVVQRQRTESMRVLRDYTRLKTQVPADAAGDELAWSLVLDNVVFSTEAEVRWLDHVESRLSRAAAQHGAVRAEGHGQPSGSPASSDPRARLDPRGAATQAEPEGSRR